MNKATTLMLMLALFLGILSVVLSIRRVGADQIIYIREDGNVDPPAAPIQRNGNVYSLTGDVSSDTDAIVVERDNVVVDGLGHTVEGAGTYFSRGLSLVGRHNVILKNLKVRMFYYGVYLENSSVSKVAESSLTGNDYGLRLHNSSENMFTCISIAGNSYGISIGMCSNNTFLENTIVDNKYDGIALGSSVLNRFFHNSFIDNGLHVEIPGAPYPNFWDDGYPSGGNYWGGYGEADLNLDGLADSPFEIDADNIDNWPLAGVFHSFNTSQGYRVCIVSNSSVDGFDYVESNNTIRLEISNMTANQAYGFCRICIPHTLLNEPYEVFVDDAEPLYVNYTLGDNGTHRWIYVAYEQPKTHEIVIVPESLIAIIASTLTMATAIMLVRRVRGGFRRGF